MNTIEKVNTIELASELAHKKLTDYTDNLNDTEFNLQFPNGIDKLVDDEDDVIGYTDEAQYLFILYYDEYLTFIEACIV
jgi:hypothetical protein